MSIFDGEQQIPPGNVDSIQLNNSTISKQQIYSETNSIASKTNNSILTSESSVQHNNLISNSSTPV